MTGAVGVQFKQEAEMGGVGSGMKALYTEAEAEVAKRKHNRDYMRRQRKLQRDGKWRKRIGRVQAARGIEQKILREALIAPWV